MREAAVSAWLETCFRNLSVGAVTLCTRLANARAAACCPAAFRRMAPAAPASSEDLLQTAQKEIQTAIQTSLDHLTPDDEWGERIKSDVVIEAINTICVKALRVVTTLSENEGTASYAKLKSQLRAQDNLYKIKMETLRSANRQALAQQEQSLAAAHRKEMHTKMRQTLADAGKGDIGDALADKERLEQEARAMRAKISGLEEALSMARNEASSSRAMIPKLEEKCERLDGAVTELQGKIKEKVELLKEAEGTISEKTS